MPERFGDPEKRLHLVPPLPVSPPTDPEDIPDSSDFDYGLTRDPEIPGADPDFDLLFGIDEALKTHIMGGEGTASGDLDIALRDPKLSPQARLALQNAQRRMRNVYWEINHALRERLAPDEWAWRRLGERVHRERSRRMKTKE